MVKPNEPPPDEDLKALCSACYEAVPIADTKVIPHWNDTLVMYVTTYRCPGCWGKTLDETRDRLSACDDPAEVKTCAEFFERYKVRVMEFRRGDPLPVLKAKLLSLLEELRTGTRKLTIGKAIPVKLPDDFGKKGKGPPPPPGMPNLDRFL